MDDITEFYASTRQQADALRRRAGDEIDWDAVADEIEALGRSGKEGSRIAARYSPAAPSPVALPAGTSIWHLALFNSRSA